MNLRPGRLLRIGRWWLAVLWAALIGSGVRAARRWCRRPPRIWHGFWPLHIVAEQVLVDRAAGYPSIAVVKRLSHLPYAIVTAQQFDLVWETQGVPPDDQHWKCLTHLLRHGDIWVPFMDCLFYPIGRTALNRWVFRLLYFVGIRIVAVTQGGDVLHWQRSITRYDWVRSWALDYPAHDLANSAGNTQARIELFCDYADFVCAGDATIARFLPRHDLSFKYFPAIVQRVEARNLERPIPKVLHAPNHRHTKGTDFLLPALAALQHKGLEFESVIVEGLPRSEALRRFQEADLIADQFCIGSYGCFALECLALGKPVLTYLDQEHLGDPVFNMPVVNTNPENMERVLAILLQLPRLRERLGEAGRAAVEKYQSVAAMAEVWDRIYRHVWWGEPLDLEQTQHFSPERQPRSFTEDPSRADFWPVPVEDLLPDIHAALRRAGFANSGQ